MRLWCMEQVGGRRCTRWQFGRSRIVLLIYEWVWDGSGGEEMAGMVLDLGLDRDGDGACEPVYLLGAVS